MLFHQFQTSARQNCTPAETDLLYRWQREIEYFMDLGEKQWRAGAVFLDYGISSRLQFKMTFLSRKEKPTFIAERILKPFKFIDPFIQYARENELPCQVGMTLREKGIEFEFYLKSDIQPCINATGDQRLQGIAGSPFLIGIDSTNTVSVYIEENPEQEFREECTGLFQLDEKHYKQAAFYSHYKLRDEAWSKSKFALEIKPADAALAKSIADDRELFFRGMLPSSGKLHYLNYCMTGEQHALYLPIYPPVIG